jgi:hypothetical protein
MNMLPLWILINLKECDALYAIVFGNKRLLKIIFDIKKVLLCITKTMG